MKITNDGWEEILSGLRKLVSKYKMYPVLYSLAVVAEENSNIPEGEEGQDWIEEGYDSLSNALGELADEARRLEV